MALQSILGGAWVPRPIMNGAGTLQYGSLALDATGEKFATIFQVPKTGSIRKILFRTGTVTTGDTLKGGIYTVDTTNGDPTTTAYGSMATGTVVVADGDDNVVKTITLGTDASATAGDFVAMVLEFNSYVAGNLTIATVTFGGANQAVFPYNDLFTAAWAKSASLPLMLLEYSDGSYVPVSGVVPWVSAFANTAFNNGSAADEYALKFSIPFPARLVGIGACVNGSNDVDFVLYDSDGSTALKTLSKDGNIFVGTASRFGEYIFASGQSLSKNTNYRLSVKPTTASNVGVFIGDVPSAAAMDAADGGQNFQLSTRVDAGSWTDTTTRRPLLYLLLDQFDDATGGSGGTKVVGSFVG